MTENIQPIEDVVTELSIGEGAADIEMTDEDGEFAFDNMAQGIQYQLTASKNIDFLNGISTLDLVNIQAHVLGQRLLDSPYKIIAADITNDEIITAIDLIELRKLILGQIDTFANNESWRFVDSDFEFVDPLDPFPYDESILERASEPLLMDNDFIGVKIGDVNGSINLSLGSTDAEIEKRSTHELYYTMSTMAKDRPTRIPVFSKDNQLIYGFQFTMELSSGYLYQILPGSVSITDENYHVDDKGMIHLSWHSVDGAVSGPSIPLFYLELEDLASDEVHVSMVKAHMEHEIYVGDGWVTKKPILTLQKESTKNQFQLYQNEPNPFSDQTNIKVYVPSAQSVSLSIYEASGKLVYRIVEDVKAGEHNFLIDQKDVGTTGLLYYTFVSDNYSETKKMMIIK